MINAGKSAIHEEETGLLEHKNFPISQENTYKSVDDTLTLTFKKVILNESWEIQLILRKIIPKINFQEDFYGILSHEKARNGYALTYTYVVAEVEEQTDQEYTYYYQDYTNKVHKYVENLVNSKLEHRDPKKAQFASLGEFLH